MARERGFKGLVALRGDAGLALAHEFKPDAIMLDLRLPVIGRLDRARPPQAPPAHAPHPRPRHLAADERRQEALRAGAVALPREAGRQGAPRRDASSELASFLDRRRQEPARSSRTTRTSARRIVELIGDGDDVEITAVGTSEEALDALERSAFDCMVLDLKLPDMPASSCSSRSRGPALARRCR